MLKILIDQEISIMTQNLKPEDKEKNKANNEKLAKSQELILGLLLNEYGEKNNLKSIDEEVKAEIQKQIRGMPWGKKKWLLIIIKKIQVRLRA